MLKSDLNFLLAECMLTKKECIWLQMTLHCCKRQNPSKMNYVYITVYSFWLALQFLTILCANLSIIFFVSIYTLKIAFQLPAILIFLSEILFFWVIFFPSTLFKSYVKNLEDLSKIPVTISEQSNAIKGK